MYVETDSTSEVFAYLTFFVYNKKVNKLILLYPRYVFSCPLLYLVFTTYNSYILSHGIDI